MAKTRQISQAECDYGHSVSSEVRVLPVSSEFGNLILCHRHYLTELRFRRDDGWTDPESHPEWESLRVYGPVVPL